MRPERGDYPDKLLILFFHRFWLAGLEPILDKDRQGSYALLPGLAEKRLVDKVLASAGFERWDIWVLVGVVSPCGGAGPIVSFPE